MKTAVKLCVAASLAVLGFGYASGACAEDIVVSEANPITSSIPGPGAQPEAQAQEIVEPKAVEAPKKAVEVTKKKRSSSSQGMPDVVNEAVGRLNASTQDITLEDLNVAREAVVKLDVLIDIEKRLNDLAKLRMERQEKVSMPVAPIAAALPASALAEPAPVASAPTPAPDVIIPADMMPGNNFSTASLFANGSPGIIENEPEAPKGISSAIEVSRITGAAGKYMALIRDGQKTRSVRAGDKLADGTQIVAISREGLTLSKDKERKTLQVRDVAQVFGGG